MDHWNFFKIYNLIKRKNLDYVLFNFTNNGEFFYDDYSQLLTTHSFRHSTFLEFVWASFPTVIIILILIPSLFLLYSLDEDFYPKFTLKVMGHQWFWTYEYSDWVELSSGDLKRVDIKFDSCLILESDLAIGAKRLLEVDKRVVLPINVTLRFLITSGDVLHSWSVPEMGIKVDAVPGRLNQFLTLIRRPGIFYGQCSELCGVAHGFMPIVIQAVPFHVYSDWIA